MKKWWKESIVYQIYPRSFYDSNGDGIGDLKGVIDKVDYLVELGITMVWLNPIFKSPNDDMGYDISGYREIMDEFGTMEEFDELVNKLHENSIRVILDLVVNHTSDEHPWFVESKKSRDNPYHDFYIWKENSGTKEYPTNWGSEFGGPVWKLNEGTGEYYLHIYSEKQPDLNWENAKLREEVYELMKFWLDKGIDGFRMDVVNKLAKDLDFPDGVVEDGEKYASFRPFSVNIPKVHDYLKEMNEKVLSKYDIVTVGETSGVTPEIADLYVREDRNELNMVFQFEHMLVDRQSSKWKKKEWKLTDLKRILNRWQIELDDKSWNSLYWSNHDQPRAVSRFGNDKEFRKESAKMLGMLIHMMKGTPFIYQGEELGMTNVHFDNLSDYKDVEIHNTYKEYVMNGNMSEAEFFESVDFAGRDNARTPMQWNSSLNSGFSKAEPWIKVNDNYKEINAEEAMADEESIFHFYKKLIQLRKAHEIIVYGDFECLDEKNEQVYTYKRKLENKVLVVIVNFFQNEVTYELPEDEDFSQSELLLANYDVDENILADIIQLRPYEARTYLYEICSE